MHREPLSKRMSDAISAFLRLKGNDKENLNPFVSEKERLNELIQKREIKGGHRCPELVGHFGVFALKDIAPLTVFGRYVGFECTNKEWNDIYDYTNADALHGEYAYSYSLGDEAEDEAEDEGRRITIDPIEANMADLVLLYINDIRSNLFEPEPADRDKELQNARFVVAKEYGWPTVFVVATKNIKKGDEVLVDYGDAYSVLLRQNKRWQRIVDVTRTQIANHIIGDTLLNDAYQL